MSVEPMSPFFKLIEKSIKLNMTGNYAVAGAVSQTDPDVICAFPITPQTQSVEGLSDVVNQGFLKSAFVNVESEIAAMSYSTAACLAGARVFTATASQGFLMMLEALPMAVGWRIPLTMLVSARAYNAPNLNIWNSWEFTLVDFGWNTIISENVQESYDSAIMASKISEDSLFPTMFVHDGFITSHSAQGFWALPHADVMKFTPKKARPTINTSKPGTWGGVVTPEYYMEGRRALDKDKEGVLGKIDNTYREFEKISGRKYNHIETWNLKVPSKTAFITMGSMCGNILSWMEKNKDCGLIKIRTYRPFPYEQLQKIIVENDIKKLIVLEKNDALNNLLPQFSTSIASATYPLGTILRSFIVGLGGRDVTKDEFTAALKKMEKVNDMKGRLYYYLGVRETKDKMEVI
jgi:pyruvate ferredoxin oxidoreductase alpha subunit